MLDRAAALSADPELPDVVFCQAQDYFRQLLIVAPETKLDPVNTSPKIRAVFDQVAAENVAGAKP